MPRSCKHNSCRRSITLHIVVNNMIIRFFRSTLRRFSQISISSKKPHNMEKCYLRYESGRALFDLSFIYSNPDSNVCRQFNFSRRTVESVESLLTRIATNLSKVVNKKSKRANKKKDPNDQSQDKVEVSVQMFENEEPIQNDIICHELLKRRGLKLKILNNYYDVIINAPWVLSISLPSSILSGFPVYPVNFKIQFAEKTHCSFTWYTGRAVNDRGNTIADEHITWEEAGSDFTYIPSAGAIGKKLKVECLPGDGTLVGPVVEAVSPGCVEAGPGKCPFESRHVFTQNKLSGNSFRLVSYNILADLYCDSEFTRTVLHPYCPAYALHIDYRKQLIMKELLGYNADIACLQEVDAKIFNYELEPVLGANSYEGVFMKKGKEVAEGLACFFRTDRFRLLNQKTMLFSQELSTAPCFKDIWNAIKENEPLVERVTNRSTAGLITVLESLDDANEILVVGNTHLYFHPDADHIRLIQGGLMIYWLGDVVKSIQAENPNRRVSVVLCGDFNSVPSCGIYQLYTTGVAPSHLEDWKSNELEAVTGLTLRQDLLLDSACGTPEYTNYTVGFADCLDYIYYDKQHIKVDQVVPLPSIEELKEYTALPSVVFPSDHIALVVDLTFVK